MDQTAHNVQQQIDLYGEPLGELVRRITAALGLTQGGLAQVIGLSAPMLSQLASAQRVKIGNPAVVSRLPAVSELANVATLDAIGPGRVAYELNTIQAATGAYTNETINHMRRIQAAGAPPAPTPAFSAPTGLPVETPGAAWQAAPPELPARTVVREIQDLFRAVASADEIQRAAEAVANESPAVAELLLAYGTGRTADALAHYEQHHG